MALITSSDLATYMQIEMDSDDEATADIIIDSIQAMIRTMLNRDLTSSTVTAEEHLIDRSFVGNVFLNKTPVGTITEARSNDSVIDPDLYTVYTWGIGDLGIIPTDLDPTVVSVDYTYVVQDDMTDTVTFVLYRAAAREYKRVRENLIGVNKLGLEDYRVELETRMFTPEEEDILSRYRKRVLI